MQTHFFRGGDERRKGLPLQVEPIENVIQFDKMGLLYLFEELSSRGGHLHASIF